MNRDTTYFDRLSADKQERVIAILDSFSLPPEEREDYLATLVGAIETVFTAYLDEYYEGHRSDRAAS